MPSAWDELWVEVPRAAGPLASARLLELGSAGLQEEDPDAPPPRQVWDLGPEPAPGAWVRLKAWFERPGGPARAQVEASLVDLEPRDLGWSLEEARDWEAEAQAAFQPIQAGPFLIAPPWNAPPGALVITPGSGFGTGDHPTTQAMLVALADAVAATPLAERAALDVLDVGCGSGVLALAAASLGLAARGIEVEAQALVEAAENARLNGLEVDFSATPLEQCAPADLVLANLHAELLVRLAGELQRVTRDRLLLAGILEEKEPAVRAAFAPWEPEARGQTGRWVTLRYRAAVDRSPKESGWKS